MAFVETSMVIHWKSHKGTTQIETDLSMEKI